MEPCAGRKCSERVAQTLKLVQNHSSGIHPGHQPGRHIGLPPEFEGMSYDGRRWHMKSPAPDASVEDGVLATLPEQERQLATRFEGSGGLALCLIRSFTMPEFLRERAKWKLRVANGESNLLPPEKLNGCGEDWSEFDMEIAKVGNVMEQVNMLLRMSEHAEETEAVQRNVWTDIDWNLGEADNLELLSRLEMQFAGQLSRTAKRMEATGRIPSSSSSPARQSNTSSPSKDPMGRTPDGIFDVVLHKCDEAVSLAESLHAEDLDAILNEPRNLGVALDLIGAYVKNYDIDKADCMLERIKPLCRQRGKMWLCKWLDKCTLIRLKQYRAAEALDALHETEALVPFNPRKGWQFFEVLYRNMSRGYSATNEKQKSLHYLHRSVEVKQANGIEPSWFDLWDLGRAHSQLGQASKDRDEIIAGYDLCVRGLAIVRIAEPGDTIIIAKLLANIGEICLGVGDSLKEEGQLDCARCWYLKAADPLQESFDLHLEGLGPQKPLVGWQAGVLSHCMVRLGKWTEARNYIAHALKVECTKDSTTPGCLVELLDRVMGIHQELEDLPSMRMYVADLELVLGSLQRRGLSQKEPELFISLLEKVATIFLASDDGGLLPKALNLLQEAEMLLLDLQRDVGLGKRRAKVVDVRSASGLGCKEDLEDEQYQCTEAGSPSTTNRFEQARANSAEDPAARQSEVDAPTHFKAPEIDLDKLLADISLRIQLLSFVEDKVCDADSVQDVRTANSAEQTGDLEPEFCDAVKASSGKGLGEKSRQKSAVTDKVHNACDLIVLDDWEIAD